MNKYIVQATRLSIEETSQFCSFCSMCYIHSAQRKMLNDGQNYQFHLDCAIGNANLLCLQMRLLSPCGPHCFGDSAGRRGEECDRILTQMGLIMFVVNALG